MNRITKGELKKKYSEIQKLYLSDERPWIVGYSGGKDSTVILQMIWIALSTLPEEKLKKKIYVVSSDTMIENPLIYSYLKRNIDLINQCARVQKIPIEAQMLKPEPTDNFWTLLIGKGYPTPRQKFRWCTSRLKIKPIDLFIDTITEQYDEVIVVLGVRREESKSRSESIEKRSVEGKLLKVHATNTKAYVYAPIEFFDNEEIWFYLMNNENPWGNNNRDLLDLYNSASDPSECVIQHDKDAPSCGHSRFGCWVCTVVSKDKSLTSFIENGYDELRPLLKFRNELVSMRDKEQNRQKWRTDGSFYYIKKDGIKKRGLGPFNLEARKKILEMLLNTEKEFNKLIDGSIIRESLLDPNEEKTYQLISDQELEMIREQWVRDGDWDDSLLKIIQKFDRRDSLKVQRHYPIFNIDDCKLLEDLCRNHNVDFELLKQLFIIERKNRGLIRRTSLFREFGKILRQDWVHEEALVQNGIEGELSNED